MLRRIFWPILLLLALLTPAMAAVDLVTLPTREGTQLTIYNSEDITMVREHRLLTVKPGVIRILDLNLGFIGVTDAMTDAELMNLNEEFPQLESLVLHGGNITDASLKHLERMIQLRFLDLTKTNVTDAGVADLQQVLPKCEITH